MNKYHTPLTSSINISLAQLPSGKLGGGGCQPGSLIHSPDPLMPGMLRLPLGWAGLFTFSPQSGLLFLAALPYNKKHGFLSWLVWLSGLGADLLTKGLPVQFPVRTHSCAVGQVLSGGSARGGHTLMFLSLSFSLPSPLSKNK